MTNKKIIEKVNNQLLELNAPLLNSLPEISHKSESLRGKKVLMVDDLKHSITTFLPFLESVTEGSSFYIFHKHQEPSELVFEIKIREPDLILLDANLNLGIKGYDLVPILKKEIPKTLLIGFSSVMEIGRVFLEKGADGFVCKDISNPETAVAEIVKITDSFLC